MNKQAGCNSRKWIWSTTIGSEGFSFIMFYENLNTEPLLLCHSCLTQKICNTTPSIIHTGRNKHSKTRKISFIHGYFHPILLSSSHTCKRFCIFNQSLICELTLLWNEGKFCQNNLVDSYSRCSCSNCFLFDITGRGQSARRFFRGHRHAPLPSLPDPWHKLSVW